MLRYVNDMGASFPIHGGLEGSYVVHDIFFEATQKYFFPVGVIRLLFVNEKLYYNIQKQ